jgi:hypothetical protein
MADKCVHGGTFQLLPDRQLHFLETAKIKFDEGVLGRFLSVAPTNKFLGQCWKNISLFFSPTVQTFFGRKTKLLGTFLGAGSTPDSYFFGKAKKSFNTLTFPLSGQWSVFLQKFNYFLLRRPKNGARTQAMQSNACHTAGRACKLANDSRNAYRSRHGAFDRLSAL